MVGYIDDHKDRFGVEPICAVLPIAASTYYEQKAREYDPDRRPARAVRDESLKPQIQRVWDENFRVYGAHKVWTQLNREGLRVARCTVECADSPSIKMLDRRGSSYGWRLPPVPLDPNSPTPVHIPVAVHHNQHPCLHLAFTRRRILQTCAEL